MKIGAVNRRVRTPPEKAQAPGAAPRRGFPASCPVRATGRVRSFAFCACDALTRAERRVSVNPPGRHQDPLGLPDYVAGGQGFSQVCDGIEIMLVELGAGGRHRCV
jgi:hypothetical protein